MVHPLTVRLAAEFRAEIARQGLTAGRVADEADISRASLSRKLSGRYDFTTGELIRLSEVLAIPVHVFAKRAEEAGAA
jgi:transcriptional regulator with XRE-family HTH domain